MNEPFLFPETDGDIEITDKLIVDYYTALHHSGVKLQIEWNGGGDSGSASLKIDDKTFDGYDYGDIESSKKNIEHRIHRKVLDRMYDTLDYGSWAGDFSASGTADFVVEEDFIGFRGIDHYSEDEGHSLTVNINVIIPKESIPAEADRLDISISDGYDGAEPNVSISFRGKDSYKALELTKQHADLIEIEEYRIAKIIDGQLNEIKGVYVNSVYQYDSVDLENWDRSTDFKFKIEEVHYYVLDETEKHVEINLLP